MTNEPEDGGAEAPAATSAPPSEGERPAARPPDRADRGERFDRGERSDRDERFDRGRGRGGGGGGRGRRRPCEFCPPGTRVVDYKDIAMLRRYLTERGKIEARRRGGCTAQCQRLLAQAIKRARHMALLPYTAEHIQVSHVPAGRPRR